MKRDEKTKAELILLLGKCELPFLPLLKVVRFIWTEKVLELCISLDLRDFRMLITVSFNGTLFPEPLSHATLEA